MHRRHYSRSYSHDTGFFFTAATNSWLSSVHSHFLWAIYLRLSEYTAFSRHHFNHQQTELLTLKFVKISSYISDKFVIKGSIFFLKITFFIIISPLLRGTRCEEEIQSYSHWRLHTCTQTFNDRHNTSLAYTLLPPERQAGSSQQTAENISQHS